MGAHALPPHSARRKRPSGRPHARPLGLTDSVTVNMEADGHPLPRHHRQHGSLLRVDWLTAGVARSPVTCGLSEAYCTAFREAVASEPEANQLLNEVAIHWRPVVRLIVSAIPVNQVFTRGS